ncbi:MAG: septum site-determining protein MinC [Thermoflexales bacterium]
MVAIKGFREGLVIVFNTELGQPWEQYLHALRQRLDSAPAFFKGGRVALDVQALELNEQHLRDAVHLLRAYEVDVWAVRAQSPYTRASARACGLADTLQPPASPTERETALPQAVEEVSAESEEAAGGLFVRRRVRSGQELRHPGYIVILGDVNPGARIIAGSDIIVWGRLQAAVHAGALGDRSAVVCALEMMAPLVRIADVTARPSVATPSDARRKIGLRGRGSAQMARIEADEIVFSPWSMTGNSRVERLLSKIL